MVKSANNSEIIEASNRENFDLLSHLKKPHPMPLVTKKVEALVIDLIVHILYKRIS